MPSTGRLFVAGALCYAVPVLQLTESDAPCGASSLSDREETDVTKYRAAKKHWKMVLVLFCICGALLLIRWAAMIWA